MNQKYKCNICGFESTNWEVVAICQSQSRRSWPDGQLVLFKPDPANNFGQEYWRAQIMSLAYYQKQTHLSVYWIKVLEEDEKIRAAYSNMLSVSEDRLSIASQ